MLRRQLEHLDLHQVLLDLLMAIDELEHLCERIRSCFLCDPFGLSSALLVSLSSSVL